MPASAGSKRVKGVSIYRPFVYGSIARPIDENQRPEGIPSDHSHQWTVWVKGVDDEDISYWLKKVQFKLHETYANAVRTIEQPPFEVTETGWGEFELSIKLFFIPESSEKPQTLWHTLKLHPYGPDAEAVRAERRPIIAQHYEEVMFNEPSEQFYEVLTGGPEKPARGKGGGKGGSKQASLAKADQGTRTAEIPSKPTRENPFSRETEGRELDRMKEALRKVDETIVKEREKLAEREATLERLRQSEGIVVSRKSQTKG
ncbi:MAG: NuA4 histone H4 acetyltransferase complex and the SWR1 complex subunit [Sclerophora amabilis]|nr:MAG: NuA4 histone H4 acetyltransferase complex and the SWR1 complex subunit [Sclerophora amabilis]